MISVTDKSLCSGCSACASRCPMHCITMAEDQEGFLYPQIDKKVCIDCGLCEKVCHVLNTAEEHLPIAAIGAQNNDSAILMNSSSGGIFSLLAENTIKSNGVVFGARFDEGWQVLLDYTDNMEGVAALRKSKYVQARTANSYEECERFLKNGRNVLFSGTPCQIAGLRNYLQKPYDNLCTVDVACHGTPSPKIWGAYIKHIKEILKGSSSETIYSYLKNLGFSLYYDEDKSYLELRSKRHENHYMSPFIFSQILRPSCYACKCKNFSSGSDLTLADFWGVQKNHPDVNSRKGISLILVNTRKGMIAIDSIPIDSFKTNMEAAIKENKALTNSSRLPSSRGSIFAEMEERKLLNNLRVITKKNVNATRSPLKQVLKQFISSFRKWCHPNKAEGSEIANKGSFVELLRTFALGKIVSVDFRNKANGWQKYCFSIYVSLKNKEQ